jgi:hypothetical protein
MREVPGRKEETSGTAGPLGFFAHHAIRYPADRRPLDILAMRDFSRAGSSQPRTKMRLSKENRREWEKKLAMIIVQSKCRAAYLHATGD